MAEVLKMPGPSQDEIEGIKALKTARMMAVECMETLIKIMQDDTVSPENRIEAARSLLYYGLEWECTHNG